MPITNQGILTCPCCAAHIILSVTTNGTIIATVEFTLRPYQEEETPQGSGDVRPGVVSEELHENLHGQAEGNGQVKAKFDRNKYQREYMRKRRGKRSEGITGKEPG